MPNATIPLTSFTGGEWSPRLHGRVDIDKYQTACEVLQNMVLYPHGGITRRMGMEYIEDAKTNDVRLIPFEYNREQAYVLEFGHNYIRFFRNGAQLLDGASPREIATTYTAAQLPDLAFTQSADTLYIVHESHPPRKVTRTGTDTFAIADITFTSPPTVSSTDTSPAWTTGNYPRAVTFFQSRLVLAGTPLKPQTIWMSRSFLFETFGAVDPANLKASDGLEFTLSSSQVNAIQWLVAGKKLLVGTTGGEWSVSGSGGAPLNAANVQADRESNFGSKNGRVQLVGNSVIYASRDGKKLREMAYSFEADGFISPELSLFSEHLTRSGIKEFDFAQNPDGILWTLMSDGTYSGFTYLKSQDVKGWHRHTTQGSVISLCTIESDLGSEVWFATLRNGAVRIERMAKSYEGTTPNSIECAYLDSYLTYDGTPVSSVSGLEHLEGMTVSILADGQHLPDQVVTLGSVSLGLSASKVIVGLKYEWRLVPLKLEGGSPMGFAQGKMKSVHELIIRFERSAGISHKIYNQSFSSTLPARKFGNNFGSPVELYSGDTRVKLHNSWDTAGQFELYGSTPLPVTILMIAANMTVNE